MVRKLANAVQPISRACHWLVATRVRRRWFLRIALIVCLFPLFLQWFLAYMVGGDARLLPPELSKAKNLLIVTAHPDDECLFFSPSILGVLDRNKSIKGGLVVMSTGMVMNVFLALIYTRQLFFYHEHYQTWPLNPMPLADTYLYRQ